MGKGKGKLRLDIDRLYQAAETAEDALPKLIERVVNEVANPDSKASLRDRTMAIKLLMDIAQTKPRMEDDLGLSQKAGSRDSPVMFLLSGEVSLEDFRRLSVDDAQGMVLKYLDGETPELPTVDITEEVEVK